MERPEAIEEAVEEERCEEDTECHSSAKRASVYATFTDSQEISIVKFVKQHPELYDKEHPHFHDRNRREALWAEIAAELKLQPFDVRHSFESQRTHYGKLSKLQSDHAPREMTKRQSWVYQQMGFLETHIRLKGANRSSGFEASPNTSKQEESCGSTTDTEHLDSSVPRERSQSIITSTPVSTTDSKTQEEFEELKGKIVRDIESIKSNHRCLPLPRRSATLPRSRRGSGYCQQPLHRRLVPLKQQLAAVLCTIHQAPLASVTLHQS